MVAAIDITGQRFGRLVAIEPTGGNIRGRRLWRCQCDCGEEKVVASYSLRVGDTQSCGCLHQDIRREIGYRNRGRTLAGKHKLCDSPEYGVWQTMKSRCTNPKAERYASYGGRGIRVCERWSEFTNFYADMGPRPEGVGSGGYALYSIERIDNDAHYTPENCRWATAKEQAANRRAKRCVPTS